MKKFLIALMLLVLCLSAAAAENTGVLGQPFPDFTVTDTKGNTFTLSEALKDHEAVLINIWATWCPPCEMEMPFLNEAFEQFGDRVAFIALSCEANDTPEIIEEYRESHSLSFPMARDEDSALYGYLNGSGIPLTVIVDRFGNAAFTHTGSFISVNEVIRAVRPFLGDGYTETNVLTEIPKDSSTLALPSSAATAVKPEAPAATVIIRTEEDPEPAYAYVIRDKEAVLRLEAAASDNPGNLLCYDYLQNTMTELPDLLDPGRGVYVYRLPMPGAEEGPHYTYVALADGTTGRFLAAVYLVAGEEYVGELAADLRSWGYTVTLEYVETDAAEETAPQAYTLHVIDQDGNPVPGVTVNFCTDTACTVCQDDGTGTITFSGAPDVYHVQLLKVPEGYSFDSDFEMYTGNTYGEWALRVRKD